MAVIVTNGNVNLNTANGFYRSDAYNFGMSYANPVAIGTETLISLTFANNGTCLGVALGFGCSTVGAVSETVTVELQENVASVWTTRVSANTTFASFVASSIEPFSFGAGYAVTTAGSTWRLRITSSGSTAKLKLWTSNGTATSYVTWSATTVSFVSATDKIVVKDILTINQTATIAAEAGTGGSIQTSMWICKAAGLCSDSNQNDRRLVWENPPAASYTLTFNGVCIFGSFTGVEIGNSSSRIPANKQAIVVFTSGTHAGFSTPGGTTGYTPYCSLQLWGEKPSGQRTYLTADAASAQANLTVADSTGFATNDTLCIGGGADYANYTVSSVGGPTSITLTGNLAQTHNDLVSVVKTSGYGVYLRSSSTTALATGRYHGFSNLNVNGVLYRNVSYTSGYTGVYPYYGVNTETQQLFEGCCFNNITAAGTPFIAVRTTSKGIKFKDCYFNQHTPINPTITTWNETYSGNYSTAGSIVLRTVYIMNCNAQMSGSPYTWDVDGLSYERSNTNGWQLTGVGSIYKNVEIKEVNTFPTMSAIYNGVLENINFHDNSGLTVSTNIVNTVITNMTWSGTAATNHLAIAADRIYAQLLIVGTNQTLTINGEGTSFQRTLLPGSEIRVTNENSVTNADFALMPYGRLIRTGSGLSDTTVYGTNTYALKFNNNTLDTNLSFEWDALLGNQANYDSYVYIWVKINNAAYYGGSSYQLPKLTVTYDQSSTATVTAAANTNWQILPISLKTLTSYPQIHIKVEGYSDAAGGNNVFYLGQTGVVLPAGRNVDPGTLAYWAKALPMTFLPTSLSAFDVWALNPADFGVGTVGDKVRKSLTLQQYIGLK